MDSQASLHMMSRNELTPEKQETMRKSVDSTVIMTAQGTISTTEKATVCVTDLDMFIDVQLLVDSPAALFVETRSIHLSSTMGR